MRAPTSRGWRWRVLILFMRTELFLWLCASFPHLVLAIVFSFITIISYGQIEGTAALLIGGTIISVFACGVVFETLRGRLLFPKAVDVPLELKEELDRILTDFVKPVSSTFRSNRVRVIMSDLSVGAHVRGVIRPNIYVSGGLLIGLLEGNNAARAIFAHELAHIYNHDRWLPGIVTIAFFNICFNLTELVFGSEAMPKILGEPVELSTRRLMLVINTIALTVVCSYMLHRREYAADFVGAMILRSRQNYAEFLRNLRDNVDARSVIEKVPLYVIGHYVANPKLATEVNFAEDYVIGHSSRRRTFTHPALESRIDAISGKRIAIGASPVLAGYWALMICGLALIFIPIIQELSQYGMGLEVLQEIVWNSQALLVMVGVGILAIVGLVIEFLRFAVVASS